MNFQLISFQQLKTSLQAMKNYILGVLPTKVSDLINDSEFTDKDYVDTELAKKQDTLPFATPPATSDIGKALMPSAISNGEVTEWEFGEAGLIDDVQVNGTSIVNNGIANIPLADTNTIGAVKVGTGLMMDNDSLTINAANSSHIKGGTIARVPIAPVRQHEAAFYGLTKAAGVDMSSSPNAVGTYTAEAKTAIKNMLGVEDPAVDDVQINGTSIISNGVADIPLATNSSYGVIKGNSPSGIAINSSGAPYVNGASLAEVKSGTHLYKPIMPFRQHEATFYGLAKAAGLDMSSSDNPVGTYTDAAKSAIQSMIGVPSADSVVDDVQINGTSIVSNGVANIPKADTKGTLGVASVSANNGISINADGVLYIYRAQDDHIKAGNVGYRPIVPQTQHAATFYGLAKAAGADMKDSANPVGTYTDEAKSAIKTMIGVPVNSYDLNLGEAIPASADLDTYTTPGIYSADRTVVSSLVNSPTTYTRFKLVVDSAADGAIFQHAILTDGNHFSRVGTLVNNTWTFTGWDKYIKRTDYATAGIAGVVKVGQGLEIESDGKLKTSNAGGGVIKDGTTNLQLLTPGRQHMATFYGLAKAAGDTTQSSSNNAVGTYTDEAKAAIKAMLGVNDGIVAAPYDSSSTYNKDDYVIYNNSFYKATQDIYTAEEWNSTHWQLTSTSNEIKSLKESISYPTAIVVTTPPTKTKYEIGNSLDKSGMVVTLIWSTGETKVLSDDEYGCSPALFNAVGTQNVTITYTGTEPYVLTTTQEVTVVNIVPDTWEKMVQVSKAGVARDFFNVGDVINDTYTIGTTEYANPWIVVDFQTVELQDGTTYDNVPILVMEYLNHEDVAFDAVEQIEATEETASAGHYYYGYAAEGTVYTALNLNVGDLIPYSDYDKVFVTLWNSVNAIRYGTNCWALSYARQYLNNSGMGWWQATHECDVIPNGYESRLGFKSYISPEMAASLHPIKITTKRSNYIGGAVDTTYDTFWLPSLNEMNIYNNSWIATVDGSPWQYYKELLENEEKVPNGTYAVLKKYSVNATTTVQHYWVRSASLTKGGECCVFSSGFVNYSYPSYQYRLSPACAVI